MSNDSVCCWPRCNTQPSEPLGLELCERHAIKAFRAVSAAINPTGQVPGRGGASAASQGIVYYVRLGNRVKIGFSTDFVSRMSVVPHESILFTKPGTLADERLEHKRFAHLRTSGEWFQADPELMAYITDLRANAACEAHTPR